VALVKWHSISAAQRPDSSKLAVIDSVGELILQFSVDELQEEWAAIRLSLFFGKRQLCNVRSLAGACGYPLFSLHSASAAAVIRILLSYALIRCLPRLFLSCWLLCG